MRLTEERSKDRGTRKLAAKLALRGHQVTASEVVDTTQPYCDDPVHVHRSIRAGGLDRSLAVTAYRPCRRCSKCLQFRAMQWRERAMAEIESAPRTWMVTLTFSPVHLAGILAECGGDHSPRAIDAAAYRHVQRFFKRIRKTTRQRFRYFAVFERGEETGRAHYHVLMHEIGRPISKAMIERQWRSHVHCRLVASTRGAASYVSKYATKSLDVRVRASSHYGHPKGNQTPPPKVGGT